MPKFLPLSPLVTLLTLSLCVTLTACGHLIPTAEIKAAAAQPAPSSVCAVFRPISFDRLKDTLPTIQAVKDSNARQAALCAPKPR